MPTYDFTCEVCGTPGRQYRSDKPPRFCSPKCTAKGRVGTKKKKYIITPEMHQKIKAVYQTGIGAGDVKALVKNLGLPKWKISRYAVAQGWTSVKRKEPDWSDKELRILETSAHRSPETIQKYLKRIGSHRTPTAIILKRKRMRFLQNKNGHSALDIAQCFGVDPFTVRRWIRLGYLKTTRRGTKRTVKQGGDQYFIRDRWIRKFIINCIDEIDIRKVDKYWFVDLLAGGQRGLDACKIEKAPDVAASEDLEEIDDMIDDTIEEDVLDLFAEAAAY